MSGKKDKPAKIENNNADSDVPPTFYDKINDNISLNLMKLVELVLERYLLLKDIESLSQKKESIEEHIKINLPESIRWNKDNEAINNDMASHFLLALIMCKNESEMKWFIRQETKLYKARIDNHKKYNMYKILSILGVELSKFDFKKDNEEKLVNNILFRMQPTPKNPEAINIFFCKFEDALNLVPSHEFFLHKGNIYIPESDLHKLFMLVFQQKMEKTMSKIRTKTESIKKDRRIREIINIFEKEKDRISKEEAAKMEKEMPNDEKLRTMNDIDNCSERCFPLCMNLIERHINQYSHLTHFGRLQYTLFLKGAGLPVDEALKFFQKKYEKKTPLDKFEKEYAYNIRHSYGLEGKRVSYTPYTCEKIINMNAPMGRECHGCPYKTYSAENLRKILSTCNLSPLDIEEIMSKKKNNEYQLACVKYFEAKFPKIQGEGIGIHPNKYFSSAMKILKNINNNKTKKEENIKEDNTMDIEENN